MLIGIIKNETHKEDYLINIEENENDKKVNITCISEKGIKSLTKNEAHSLMKILLSGKLRYLEDYNEYKVYLDEANNKRYFKDGKEDLELFLLNNGVDAMCYIERIDKKIDPDVRRYKIDRGLLKIGIFLNVYSTLIMINTFGNNYKYYVAPYLADSYSQLDLDQAKELIYASPYITDEEKDKLYNEDLLNLVLNYSDSNRRNYYLTEKLTNIDVKYYGVFDILYEEADGHYNPIQLNKLYVKNIIHNNEDRYFGVLRHEYVHLLQSETKYLYIKESCAELISHEFYGETINSYKEGIKRTKVLMEIIGVEPILSCNFEENDAYLESSIKQYLSEEDANRLLKLLETSGLKMDKEEIHEEIDGLLAKMYYNKTNKDISADIMINLIYQDYCDERIYFNSTLENYNKDFYLIDQKETIDELELNDIVNSNIVEEYTYSITETKTINGKTSNTITRGTAKNFNEIPTKNISIINMKFKDGTMGYCSYNEKNNEWGHVTHYKMVEIYEPSIPKKFPNQHKERNKKPELNEMFKKIETTTAGTKSI